MAHKKIIFVIVEGPSDDDALGALFNRIFDKNTVYVHIMHCDITTEKRVDSSNIISKIGNVIRLYAKANHFNQSDFMEIIHIVDMDGAYIPNDHVINDESVNGVFYSEIEIRTNNKFGIEQRNEQKRANLNKLYSQNEVWKIPYRVFYMSCNLDHVLYNKLNSGDLEKEKDSLKFAKKFHEKVPEFLDFISNSDFSVKLDYKESWKYIKKDLHSLERHTNLSLRFESWAQENDES